MFLCRSCLTGSEEVGFGALGSNVLVILEATMMFMKYSQDHPLTNKVTGGLTKFHKLNWC